MEERNKILVVINTLGRAGAEKALLELLRQIDSDEYEMFLYVLMGQGEMIRGLPSCVRVLNKSLSDLSVFTNEGRRKMARTVLHAFWSHGRWCRKLGFIFLNLTDMARKKGSSSANYSGGRFPTERSVLKQNLIWQLHGWRAVPLIMWRIT